MWKSGDFGRTWTQVTGVTGLGVCATGTTSADVNQGRVTLVCAGSVYLEDQDAGSRHSVSYTSTDPTLTSWSATSTSNDALGGLAGFTVNRMAVPFDGKGSLVALGGGASPGFATAVVLPGTDVWVSTDSAITWTQLANAPWSSRWLHSATTDAEQLTLIMLGGFNLNQAGNYNYGVVLNEVWQLTWTTASGSQPVQTWHQLPNGAFQGRKSASLYTAHDWLFLYAGSADYARYVAQSLLDDVWASPDYGTTWTQLSSNGTGLPRHSATALSISRRLFVVGGTTGSSQPDYSPYYSSNFPAYNDVWVAYW